ncbi:hypothetical protein KX729_28755 [Rhizobium sp. XQZ8]|uniref:hypothetical protein n=1 Tax=Rhizobium populisoli TaxID=2859785 RepID=UPI001CA5A7F9|nr:hypothetical protein [Rhizobium populisoli]MBW6425420.1 hypothetical protein [Rhizobium populisoli]
MADSNNKTVVAPTVNRVDGTLSTGADPARLSAAAQQRELEELRAELRYARSAARRPMLASSKPVAETARSTREKVEYQITLQPIKSVTLAAVVGFVYGIAL